MAIRTMKSGGTVRLAGHRFINYKINKATLNFRTTEDELLTVRLPSIGALVPTKKNKKIMDDVKHIPSIIGNDFLESQGLALYFNPSAQIVYLEYEI